MNELGVSWKIRVKDGGREVEFIGLNPETAKKYFDELAKIFFPIRYEEREISLRINTFSNK